MPRRGSLIAYIQSDENLVHSPLVPGSWELIEESGDWSTIYPLTRSEPSSFIHAWQAFKHNTQPRACYVMVGVPSVLQYVIDFVDAEQLGWAQTWSGLGTLRSDVGATASLVKGGWKDLRPISGGVPIGELISLFARVAGYEDDDGEELINILNRLRGRS